MRSVGPAAGSNRYARGLVEAVAAQFDIPGKFAGAEPIRGGHIHDTFVTRHETMGRRSGTRTIERQLFQRVNTDVFRDPDVLMDNIGRVCRHLRHVLERSGVSDPDRRCLRIVPTRSGLPLWRDEQGQPWRCFRFQEEMRSVDEVEQPQQAYQAARAFGEFVRRLDGLPDPPLAETIPHFHDLEHRYQNLRAAVRADPHGRAVRVGPEIELAVSRYEAVAARLARCGASELPTRIVHNDCKINNVLLDARSGEGLCVIDLDTVMAGTILSDFGELVRTTASRSPEDEIRTETMVVDPELLRAVALGFCEGAGSLLTPLELDVMPLAGSLMALENGIRFLTDHLLGDTYFKIRRPGHNLDRFRAQLQLVELLDRQRALLRDALPQRGPSRA